MEKNFGREFRFGFTQTIPVLLGYLFLGIAFGLLMNEIGYGPVWAFLTSLFVYAGSMQFVLVGLIANGAGLFSAAVMTLFVNGRHIFYGLSFLEKFRSMGKAYPYMVFSLTDETYSVLCNLKVPGEYDEKKVSLMISALNHFYWVIGSVLGGVVGSLITFDTTGIDFSMTALFVVIVINQWTENREHRPALVGGVIGLACLVLLGPDRFLLPALALTSCVLLGGKKRWNM